MKGKNVQKAWESIGELRHTRLWRLSSEMSAQVKIAPVTADTAPVTAPAHGSRYL